VSPRQRDSRPSINTRPKEATLYEKRQLSPKIASRPTDDATRHDTTLAAEGRTTIDLAGKGIRRLQMQWRPSAVDLSGRSLQGLVDVSQLDDFDRVQLEEVVRVCRQSKTISDAGRKLFAVSRNLKTKPNDADRLRKYLGRFELTWESLRR